MVPAAFRLQLFKGVVCRSPETPPLMPGTLRLEICRCAVRDRVHGIYRRKRLLHRRHARQDPFFVRKIAAGIHHGRAPGAKRDGPPRKLVGRRHKSVCIQRRHVHAVGKYPCPHQVGDGDAVNVGLPGAMAITLKHVGKIRVQRQQCVGRRVFARADVVALKV